MSQRLFIFSASVAFALTGAVLTAHAAADAEISNRNIFQSQMDQQYNDANTVTGAGLSANNSDEKPPMLKKLQEVEEGAPEKQEPGFQIRKDAQREAALSYGARGGLAWRTYEIRQRLKRFEDPLSRLYGFRQLLISAPGGLYIEPPVVGEALDALDIKGEGQRAVIADKILQITRNARLVPTAREWRAYLERDWIKPEPPPDILLPKTEEERANWEKWIAEGWKNGIQQAEDILEDDLTRLNQDFTGMVRYRKLLAQAMISQPVAIMMDRGVTGGGVEMRIGDRAVEITGEPQLLNQAQTWQPISLSTPR